MESRRVVPTLDFATATENLPPAALQQTLRLSVTHFYEGIVGLRTHLAGVLESLPKTMLPPHIAGTIQQPGGEPASRVHVEANLPSQPLIGGAPNPQTVTADDG